MNLLRDTTKEGRIAAFRYSLIAPLISGANAKHYQTIKRFYIETCGTYELEGRTIHVSPATLKRWYYAYKAGGLDALAPRQRKDKGSRRALREDVDKRIDELLAQKPTEKAQAIYKLLLKERLIVPAAMISYPTICRIIKGKKAVLGTVVKPDRRSWQHENFLDLWQADTTYCPKVTIDGKLVRVYVMAIIDDASRLVVSSAVVTKDSANNFMKVLRDAIKTYGKPRILYVDNGASYANHALHRACGELGIELQHARPRDCQAKGKVERLFRTLKGKWQNAGIFPPEDEPADLMTMNNRLQHFMLSSYNNQPHSTINMTPYEKWVELTTGKIHQNLPFERIEKAFTLTSNRRVSATRTILLDNKEYELPFAVSSATVMVQHSLDYDNPVVEIEDKLYPLALLDRTKNASTKRIRLKSCDRGEPAKKAAFQFRGGK